MPQFNLTTATPEELRQLLASTRRRGDAALSYQILQEMAARREAPEARRGFLRRRPAEPRHISVDLGDPLDAGDEVPPMPKWRPPSERSMDDDLSLPPRAHAAAPKPSRRRPPRRERPRLTLDEAVADLDPAPAPSPAAEDPHLRLERTRPDPRPPRRGGRFPLLVFGLALGIPLGMAFGWWVATAPQARTASPPAQPIEVAAVEPQPVAAAPPALIPTPPETPAAAPAEAASAPSAETPPATADAEPKVVAQLTPSPPPPEAAREPAPMETVTPAAAGCAAQPTPADREICATPRLRRLQEELRRAYAQALDAHQDRALLRSRQLAWRDGRNAIADPQRLASLYSERIRKLNAATEAAKSQR